MRIRLRLCLNLLFALFAVFLTSPNSLATQMAALPTKSVHLAVFSSVTTTTTEGSVSRIGGVIGLSAVCPGLVKAFHALPIGIQKPNCGIFAEIGRTLAAKGGVRAFEVGPADDLLARSLRGDKLDIHHVGQAHPFEQIIPGYDRATAPAIAIPRAQHSAIPTVRGPYTGTARDQLAKDIRDLRNCTDAPNSGSRLTTDCA
jgi:hypothetical protein